MSAIRPICHTLRQRNATRVAEFDELFLGQVAIDDLELDPKSRDDIPAVLQGIQFIHRDADLLSKILNLLTSHLLLDSDAEANGDGCGPGRGRINPDVRRPGMTLWSILVLAILKQAPAPPLRTSRCVALAACKGLK